MTYHPEGGSESSLQLSDPAATETTLTDLQNNTNYTITVVATAGEHRRESVARTCAVHLPQQCILNSWTFHAVLILIKHDDFKLDPPLNLQAIKDLIVERPGNEASFLVTK